MTILDEIFAHKRQGVEARLRVKPLAAMRREAETAPAPLDFVGALQKAHAARRAPALIAEVKFASPSRGVLVKDCDALRIAEIYQQNGAAAVSVLTDERFFRGRLEYLYQIRQSQPELPLLRKDFIFHPYQVYEARAAGASAVLLIAAHLDTAALRDLHALILELGMAALVEVHSREELESVLPVQPALVGINNRDLRDFSVRLETSLHLRPLVPEGVCVVAESGIHTTEDVACLSAAGVNAILVGEALVTAPDIAARVRSLSGLEAKNG